MALTKFHIGQRVRIIKVPNKECDIFKNAIGTIIVIQFYYEVRFDSPIDGVNSICCEEDEMCEHMPTDIMDYLKHKLLEDI